jgi:hypothetical protein
MGRGEERAELAQRLRERCSSLIESDPGEVLRENQFGQLSFGDLRPDFEQIRAAYEDLQQAPLESLPYSCVAQIDRCMNKVDSAFRPVFDFNYEANSPAQRDPILQGARTQIDQALQELAPHLALALAYKASRETAISSVLDEISIHRKTAEDTLTELNSKSSEAERIIAAMQGFSAKAGVSKNQEFYKCLADKHRSASISWLVLAAASALAFVVMPLVWKLPTIDQSARSSAGLPQFASYAADLLPHISLAVLLVIGMIVGTKLFSSERHNEVLNRHRETALATFRAFYEADERPEIQAAVLLAAANAIFTPQATGYLKAPIDIQQLKMGPIAIASGAGNTES